MWIADDQNKTWKNLHLCQAEDAGTFWVREVPSSEKSEELTNFLNLENQMNDYFKKKRKSSSTPNIGNIVCVCIKDCWFRGRVHKVQEASKYENETEVFLLDYGENIWVKECNLVCLETEEWSSVPYQARRIRIFGICPTTLNYEFAKDGVKVVRSKVDDWEWDPAATQFVKNLIDNNPRATFVPVLVKESLYLTIGSLSLSMTSEHWQLLPDFAREHVLMPIDGSKEHIDLGRLLIDCGFATMDTEAILEEISKYEEKDRENIEIVPCTSEQIHPKSTNTERNRGRGRGLLSVSGCSSPGQTSLSSVIVANGQLNCISSIRSNDNRSVASSKSDFDSIGLPNGSQILSSDIEEIPAPKTNYNTKLLIRSESHRENKTKLDCNNCKLYDDQRINKYPTGSGKPSRSKETTPRKSDNIEETKMINLISSLVSPLSSCSSQSSLSPPNVSVRYERESRGKSCGSIDKQRRKSSNSFLTINNQTFDLDSSSDDSDNAFEESPKRKILRAKRTSKKTSKIDKPMKSENESGIQSNDDDLKKLSCLDKTSEHLTLNISDLENKIGKLLNQKKTRNGSSSDEKELTEPSHHSKIPDPVVQNGIHSNIVENSPFSGLTSSEKTPAIEGLILVPEEKISCIQKHKVSDDGVDKLSEFIKRIELINGYDLPLQQAITTDCNNYQELIESGEKQDIARQKEFNILDEVSLSESEIDDLIASLSSNTCNIDVTSWVSSHFTNRSEKTSSKSLHELLGNSIKKVDNQEIDERAECQESSTGVTAIESNIQRNLTDYSKSSMKPASGDSTAIEHILLKENAPKTSHQSHSFALDTLDEWTQQPKLDINDSEFIYMKNKNSIPEGLNISRLFRVFVAGESQIPDEDVIITKDNMTTLLNDHIVNILENMGTKATCLQGYMWPLLCKGSSAVCVGAQRSGKTMGYIVPLLSILLDTWQFVNERLLPGIGAVMVIVCSGWRNVQHVGQCIHAFLPRNSNLKVVTSWGGCAEEAVASARLELLNGCDILVTTAPALSRLLAEDPAQGETPGTSLARCCHLVIDDAQHVLEYFVEDVKKILKSWGDGGYKKSRGDLPQQIVVVASTWQKRLQDLTLTLNGIYDLTIVIAAPAEAAKAAKVKTIVHYAKTKGDAHAFVIDLIRNTYASKRSLIFTSSNAESRAIKKLLECVAIKCIYITEKKKKWEIQDIVRQWHASKTKTMLVSEGAVQELLLQNICNADAIIHTHISELWSEFLQKYSFMIDNFNLDFESGKSECVSHVVLLQSTVELQPFVVDELKNLGSDIPSEVICSAEAVNHEDYQPIPLCHFLKFHGECKMGFACEWRHKVNVEDVPKEIPRSGDVDVKVVKVVNASRYLVHITEWRHGNTKINMSNNYLNLFLVLQQYYADPSNHFNIKQMESGQLCGVLNDGIWLRARIIRINYSLKVPIVLLFLIDTGDEITLESKDVFELPTLMCTLPQLIVEVYLCCIRPFDMDNEWTQEASNFVHDTFTSCQNDTKLAGKIALALGPKLWTPTLWLSPLVELVQIGKKMVKRDSIRSRLLAQRFGVDNPKHLELLKEQCSICGLPQDENYLADQSWRENYENFEKLTCVLDQQCRLSILLSQNQETNSYENEGSESRSQTEISPPLLDGLSNSVDPCNSVTKCLDLVETVDSTDTKLSNGTHNSENTLKVKMSNLSMLEKSSTCSSFSSAKDNVDAISCPSNNSCSVSKVKSVSKDSSNSYSFDTAKDRSDSPICTAIMTSQEELPLHQEVQVEVGEVESPEYFFVIREDNFDGLDNVEDSINKNKDWMVGENASKYSVSKTVPVHHHCIAKFTDGKYYRGWVDRNDGSMQRVFFLDHGEIIDISVTEVYPCPEKYLKALPAQAIPCSLAHVTVPKSLQEAAATAMERIIDASDRWIVKALKALKVDENGDGMIYEVELVDASITPPKQLWRQLLAEGVVMENLEEMHVMNQVPLLNSCIDTPESTNGFPGSLLLSCLDTPDSTSGFPGSLLPSCLDTPDSSGFPIPGEEACRFLFSLPGMKEQYVKYLQHESASYVDVDNVDATSSSENGTLDTQIESKAVQTVMNSKKIKEIDTFKDQPRTSSQNGKGIKGEKLSKKRKTFILKNESSNNMADIDKSSEKKYNENTSNSYVSDKNSNRKKYTKKKSNQKKNVNAKRNIEKERNYFQKKCLAMPSLEAVEGVTERFNPITRWWQDQHMVYMKLSVAASTGYKCRLTETNITFMTVVEERWFVMDEILFDKIDPDLSFVKPEGTCIIISLTKIRCVTWRRLTTRDDALPWLTSQCTAQTDDGSESDLVQEQPGYNSFMEDGRAQHGKSLGGYPAGISDTDNSHFFASSNSSLDGGMSNMLS